MIELNLLPEQLKVKKKQKIEWAELPIIPVIVWVVILTIGIHALSILFVEMNRGSMKTLKKEWENYAPKKKEMEELTKELSSINAKVSSIEELEESRIVWARKMNNINDSMLPSIWLSSFSLKTGGNTKTTLFLEGFATGVSEEGTASVGRFINSLKHNEEFFSGLEDIELEDMRRSVVEKKEVMKFRLSIPLKETGN